LDTDFASALTDAPSYIVQYGGVGGNWTTRFCAAMTQLNTTTATNGTTTNGTTTNGTTTNGTQQTPMTPEQITTQYGQFHQTWMKENNIKPASYNGNPVNTTLQGNMDGGRQWFWQVCTQFGYWQTAPPAPLPRWRSQLLNVAYNELGCVQSFGDGIQRTPAVDTINAAYGAQSINVPRVAYVNGELDPWRRLSVYAAPVAPAPPRDPNDPMQPMWLIKGGSHCTDFNGKHAGDSDSLNAARDGVDTAMKRWLGMPTRG